MHLFAVAISPKKRETNRQTVEANCIAILYSARIFVASSHDPAKLPRPSKFYFCYSSISFN